MRDLRYYYRFYILTAREKCIETHSKGREGLRSPSKAGISVRGDAKSYLISTKTNLTTKFHCVAHEKWLVDVRGVCNEKDKFTVGACNALVVSEQEVTILARCSDPSQRA